MKLGGYTTTGPREANEDSYYVIDFSHLDAFPKGITSFILVSDGMGGYQGGDIASGLAASSAEHYIMQVLEMAAANQMDFDPVFALHEICQNAHEAIITETRERGRANMGATFVGAFLSPDHAWIGHIGDSRAYLLHEGNAIQITEDHSQVGRMLSQGLITEEEAQSHPARNRIERALGFSDPSPEINEIDLEPGDGLLLCSDGVYTVLDAATLGAHAHSANDADAAAKTVVKAALASSTDDNSTAVIAMGDEGLRPSDSAIAAAGTSNRVSQPTIRMDAVLPEEGSRSNRSENGKRNRVASGRKGSDARNAGRGGKAAGRHAGNRRSGGNGRVRNSGSAHGAKEAGGVMPFKAKVFLLAIIAIAVILIVLIIIFFNSHADDVSVPAGNDANQTELLDDGSSAANGSDQSDASTEPEDVQETDYQLMSGDTESFVTLDGAALRYVDENGSANSFDQLLGESFSGLDVVFNDDSNVVADAVENNYQNENFTYRALTLDYLNDFFSDFDSYLNDENVSFTSALSEMVDRDSYRQLLEALSTANDETGYDPSRLRDTVRLLIINSEYLSSSNRTGYEGNEA